jgi:hypothetical protein
MPSRNALICNMTLPGVWSLPLWKSLLSAGSKTYESVFLLSADDLLAVTSRNAVTISTGDDAGRHPALRYQELSQAGIRRNGQKILKLLGSLSNPDVFFCGDYHAVRLASRLSLWCRENNNPSAWAAVPCCPFNSVPFVDFSVGFGSALANAAAMGTILHNACNHVSRETPVGILVVSGDRYGWLTAGTAALAGTAGKTHCILPGTQFSPAQLCKVLAASLNRYKHILLVMSDMTGLTGTHHSKTGKEDNPRYLSAAIEEILGTGVRVHAWYPANMVDPAHLSKRDIKNTIAMGRAAVRLARSARNGILVINHRNPGEAGKLSVRSTPLLEAVNTVRTVPESYFRSKTFTITPALLKLLAPFKSPEG